MDLLTISGYKDLEQRTRLVNKFKTHQTGKFIVQKSYKEAVFSILKASDQNENVNEAVRIMEEEEDYEKAYKKLEYRHKIEKDLVFSLIKNKDDFLRAIMSLTKTLRNLYGHAYQSYLWNTAVSRRLKAHSTHICSLNSDWRLYSKGWKDYST